MLAFKECTCCKKPWYSREDFLGDSKLDFVGYQVNFSDLELGYFLFNHLSCQSTIAVHAGLFKDLYDGPVFSERKQGPINARVIVSIEKRSTFAKRNVSAPILEISCKLYASGPKANAGLPELPREAVDRK
jgi:hypothetical protein